LFDVEEIHLNPDLDLNLLSKVIGEPRNKLSKYFSQRETTFTDFVHDYRINAFIHLLKEGKSKNYGIEGLALEVGFNSRATFYRAFKKKEGVSPSEYAKALNA
jgi:AraC-like DNA-binding protein